MLPFHQYVSLRGLKDEKFARKQLKQDLDTLNSVSFSYRFRADECNKWKQAKLFETNGQIKNSIIYAVLDSSIFPILPAKQYMWLPYEILKTQANENITARILLTWRICQHKRMNLDRPNADRITVETLLKNCPVIPSPEQLGKAGQINKRIIEPFEKVLDNCKFIQWSYKTDACQRYIEFIQNTIKMEWTPDPYADSGSFIKAKSNRRAKHRKTGSQKEKAE